MEIKSPLLSSNTTRNNLGQGKAQVAEISKTLAAIDRVGALYDALRDAQVAVNPQETPEARAMRYENQYNKSVAKARDIATEAGAQLDALAKTIDGQALFQAGLTSPPASAQEIRASLRSMSQADRDKAIADAFQRGDAEVLASIYGQNRVTWGGSSKPLDQQFKLYIDKAAPDAISNRQAVDKAFEGLTLAVDTFMKSADGWRDPLNAAKGFKQQEEYDKADAALRAALGG